MGLSSANNRQHGGNHYMAKSYQHWDFACDNAIPYLLGCATKYVARWREKGGKLDLEKSLHYIEKAMERNIYAVSNAGVEQFASQLPDDDAKIVRQIMSGDYAEAIGNLDYLIENYEAITASSGPAS